MEPRVLILGQECLNMRDLDSSNSYSHISVSLDFFEIMSFGAAFLLSMLTVASSQVLSYPDKDCDFSYRLLVSQTLIVQGPSENGTYMPGVTCRWIFNCPDRYCCRLYCYEIDMPESPICNEDMLLVSHLGSTQLIGADKYCGRTTLTAKSVNRRITMGLISSKSSPGGRFKCRVKAESALV